ncbi:MAG: hypothetical protein RLN76_01300 [Phycisphaeraceae bacterium]
MSLKYQRVKQHDLTLPTPVRWLTRAFSSIRLSVCLLTLVALYGTIASVPVGFLALGAAYALIGLGVFGALGLPWALIQGRMPKPIAVLGWTLIAIVGTWITYLGCFQAFDWATHTDAWRYYGKVIIYQLPGLEMTELQFYSWWPMQLILMLFVVNMIWATIRRIEFKFENIGVLTVHTGIVTLTLGSILYSTFKVEGDLLLFRQDIEDGYENVFYDAVNPAFYVLLPNRGQAMVPLPELPRYNDYPAGTLDIPISDRDKLEPLIPEGLSLRIIGFLPDAEIEETWALEPTDAPGAEILATSPVMRLALAGRETPNEDTLQPEQLLLLASAVPGERYVETHHADIELLTDLSEQRASQLLTEVPGEHGLIVEVPATGYREVFPIEPGQTITAGSTGYQLTIEEIGPYGLPFVTPGYEEATDTRAVVQVQRGSEMFRRLAMSRFPERSQDFVPQPDDPNAGPLGQRRDPDPAIRLTYLDRSKPQFHLVWSPDQPDKPVELIANLPRSAPLRAPLGEDRFPISRQLWVHMLGASQTAAKVRQPAIKPRPQRDPKDIGGYTASLMLVEVKKQIEGEEPWERIVMLHHMRYPRHPSGKNRPETITVPGVGPVTMIFARERHRLPFIIGLAEFQMDPYPDTYPPVPRDFSSDLLISRLHPEDGVPAEVPQVYRPSLNNPAIVHSPGAGIVKGKLKLSQVGWDPGDQTDPAIEARDDNGRFINQQRFSIIGVGNNVGIQIIFVGACLIVAGVPWAFYVKPWLLQRRKRQIQHELAQQQANKDPEPGNVTNQNEPELISAGSSDR